MMVEGVTQNYVCVGQNFTLTCDVEATSHIWRTSQTSMLKVIVLGIPFDPDGPLFTYSVSNEANLVTSATAMATMELNGTIVSCGEPQNLIFLNATILVLGELLSIRIYALVHIFACLCVCIHA